MVTNGGKQGGILSPVVFTLCVDQSLLRLRNTGVGCHIGNVFTGGLGYADDINLTETKRTLWKPCIVRKKL